MTLLLAGPTLLSVAATSNAAGNFTFTLSATQTAITPGRYQWNEVASLGVDRWVADQGVVNITPDLTAVGANGTQTWEEATLAVVEAVIQGRATADMQSYQIAGRQVTKIPVTELLSVRANLAATVELQRHPGRLVRDVKISFPKVTTQ